MTEEQKEILLSIGAIDEEFQYYYFSEDGKLFTPLKDKDGKMVKSGEQVYKEDYLNPPTPQPSEVDLLKEKQELMQKALDDLLLGGAL
jgi:hypothetical protein